MHAPLHTEVDGGEGCAIFSGGQLARVAVGEDAVAILDQRQAILANRTAHADILFTDSHCLIVQQALDIAYRKQPVVRSDPLHAVQRPEQVDRRGPGGGQVILGLLELLIESVIIFGLDALGGQVNADGCCYADSRGTAYFEQIDSIPYVLLVGEGQDMHLAGQPGLVNDDQRAARVIQGHCIHIHDIVLFHIGAHGFLLIPPLWPRASWR